MIKIKDSKLTKRELEIAFHLINGKSKIEIAKMLGVSTSTIKTHVEHIYNKLGVHCKVELAVYVIKNNIIDMFE